MAVSAAPGLMYHRLMKTIYLLLYLTVVAGPPAADLLAYLAAFRHFLCRPFSGQAATYGRYYISKNMGWLVRCGAVAASLAAISGRAPWRAAARSVYRGL